MQLQPDSIKFVGTVVAAVIIILTIVFGFIIALMKLRGRLNGARKQQHDSERPSSGELPPEYWQLQAQKVLVDTLRTIILPILQQQHDLMCKLTELSEKANELCKDSYNLQQQWTPIMQRVEAHLVKVNGKAHGAGSGGS